MNWPKFGIWILATLLFSGVLLGEAKASDERFAVEVNVDVTDENASQARERAMNEANRAAIVEVAKRITTVEGAARLGAMTDDQLVNFIKEVSVNEEKSSSVRYIANLQVVLNEGMLREYMKERNIPLLLQSNTRILIIPVFRAFDSDRPMLWEGDNLWRQAWEEAPRGEIVNFIPLPSSGTNYAIIDANKALAVDGEAMDKLMRVNGTDDVYVLEAVYDGIDGLTVKATSYKGDIQTFRVPGDRSAGMQLFKDAVRDVEQQIEDKIRRLSLKEGAQETSEVVMFNFNSLREWVSLESVLNSIPYIKDIEMQAMGTNKAQFKLIFVGSHEKLLYALREKSYNLLDRGGFSVIEKV